MNTVKESDKFKDIFFQAPAGICILSGSDLIFELINPSFQRYFPLRHFINTPIIQSFPELEDQPEFQKVYKVLQTGVSEGSTELKFRAEGDEKSGFRYFNFTCHAMKDEQGRITGILLVAVEVTNAVLARRKVEQNERRVSAILDAIPQMTWTNTIDGIVNFYSQRWYDYTGMSLNETKVWGWQQVINPEDLEHTLDKFRTILNGTTGGEFENRYMMSSGQYRWHLNRMQPILDIAGNPVLWIGTATDIEELKGLQQQKDDFVSIASHELKTPLTSLNLSMQLINEMKENLSPQLLNNLMQRATKSLDKVVSLVEDLLNVSKLNQGHLQLNKSLFILSKLVNECCSDVKVTGKYSIKVEGDTELKIYADPERIEQVIVNFVNNAVKYAPESYLIRVRIEKIKNFAKVSVIDQGPGIETKKIPYLFERYYRVNESGSQYSGLGLGLYICAEIIKKHGGQISVDSDRGKGSSFWFTLPIS